MGLVLTSKLVRQNFRVKVYEQAQSFRETDTDMTFTANSTRCTKLMDPAILVALRLSDSIATSNDLNDPNDFLRWIDEYKQLWRENTEASKNAVQARCRIKRL